MSASSSAGHKGSHVRNAIMDLTDPAELAEMLAREQEAKGDKKHGHWFWVSLFFDPRPLVFFPVDQFQFWQLAEG